MILPYIEVIMPLLSHSLTKARGKCEKVKPLRAYDTTTPNTGKQDKTIKQCSQCLKDKELACFDYRDKYNHRFDTCQDCRKPAGKASERTKADCSIRWLDCMLGLKSGMIRRNHAKKWHDWAKISACGNARDTKSCFLQKKSACGNAHNKNHGFL